MRTAQLLCLCFLVLACASLHANELVADANYVSISAPTASFVAFSPGSICPGVPAPPTDPSYPSYMRREIDVRSSCSPAGIQFASVPDRRSESVSDSMQFRPVPEPSAFVALFCGVVGIIGVMRRTRTTHR